jgi:hypothetical protein
MDSTNDTATLDGEIVPMPEYCPCGGRMRGMYEPLETAVLGYVFEVMYHCAECRKNPDEIIGNHNISACFDADCGWCRIAATLRFELYHSDIVSLAARGIPVLEPSPEALEEDRKRGIRYSLRSLVGVELANPIIAMCEREGLDVGAVVATVVRQWLEAHTAAYRTAQRCAEQRYPSSSLGIEKREGGC